VFRGRCAGTYEVSYNHNFATQLNITFTALERSRNSRVGMYEIFAACPGFNQEMKVSSSIAGYLTNVVVLFLKIMRGFKALRH